VTILAGFLFWDILVDMAHDWWTVPALTQGMLLPPFALYVAWQTRYKILSKAPVIDSRGLLITAFACVTYILGQLASEFFLMRFSFIILIVGLIWTFWGLARLRALGFPLLLLATMVPLPAVLYNSLSAPLQLFASDVAARVSQSVGISVYRDGNVIQLAGTSLGVAEACSGLNSVSALFVGSLVVGYLYCSGILSRFILCVVSIPLAIAVNVARVSGTAILADYNEAFAMGFYHFFSGWLVFVIGAVLLFGIARALHTVLDAF
jgi:exosortase